MSQTNDDAGMPIAITLEPGTYFRCTCGKSNNLPFCDGAHRTGDQLPIRFEIEEKKKVYICSCGKSKNQPLCDQSCGVELP